jgi:two-component system phosphate regulon sensor histidine kinase PhoR
MRRTIFIKIFTGYVLVILLVTGLFLFFTFRSTRTFQIESLTTDLEHLAVALSTPAAAAIESGRFEELDAGVKSLGREIGTRITVIAPDGTVLADSEEDPRIMENHARRPEIARALEGETGSSLRHSTTVEDEMLYVAVPVTGRDGLSGVVRTSLHVSGIDRFHDLLERRVILFALVIAALSLSGALFIARGVSRPVRALREASRRLAEGDFDARVEFHRRDELQDLGDGFNRMAATMKRLFTDLSRRKEELNGLVTSLQEGLVVIDGEGRVAFSNDSFRALVGEEVEGRHWWEVVRDPEIGDLIRRVARDGRNASLEVEFRGRPLLLSLTPLGSEGGLVAMFHDITEIRKVEAMKRDLVVNASHELRTPLTAVKGFTETLAEDARPDQRHFLDIIRRHTDRLIGIVDDLLVLSDLERRDRRVDRQEIDLTDLVRDVAGMFRGRADEKGIPIRIEAAGEIPPLPADRFRLEQMLINLLDNALKYTDRGEITISLAARDDAVTIEVRDTGIGIPEEHHARIFERFYVVDKSRSRRLGGTGLGLSIVKHIVRLHGGTIELESGPGRGTAFIVTLPVTPPQGGSGSGPTP